MNDELLRKRYFVVRNFIESWKADDLAEQFDSFARTNPEKSSQKDDVEKSFAFYNFKPFVGLMLDKLPDLEKLVGSELFPTYSFARIYENEAVLTVHKDRPACEVSVTLNLNQDKDWDIWFAKGLEPDDTKDYVNLKPGDACIYLGSHVWHARDPYEGNYYTQSFLHYVFRNGLNSDELFDNKELLAGG